ncbi:ABC transporter ATP-binding protein/permease [Gammaproteobacteria bacterium]|nr:ABC transporter ATP-binding protein/permease [Gammaproteobacteria bacterium]
MYKLLKELFTLLTPSQRKRFYVLQILVTLVAIIEILSVASIIPFMVLVSDMDQLQEDTFIAQAYQSSGIASETQFMFLIGLCVVTILIISSLISIFTIWKLSMFAYAVGSEISDRLYTYYLRQDWLFHSEGSSAQLTKKIATETVRVTGGILVPLMHLNAKVVLALLMITSIFIYDAKVAIVGAIIFTLTYYTLIIAVKKRLESYGSATTEVMEQRFRLMNEGFGGIKDLLLLGRDYDFIKRFNKTGIFLAFSQGTGTALIQAPRYLIELIAFGSLISLVLFLLISYDGDLSVILPILTLYAVGAIKLLPAFQQIYQSISVINTNTAAFDEIREDLKNIKLAELQTLKAKDKHSYLYPKKQLALKNISFTYPNKDKKVLNQINISMPARSIIGIVGPSGAGKSTIIDVLLGLIKPQQGYLVVDDTVIDDHNRRSWQNSIGFVAQNIFLSEGTIAENVAFGVPNEEINLEQVQKALNLASLGGFCETLTDGIHTKVGERGVQLSGGQRQRVGIARALYHKVEVIVFDEATSSLDGITEKQIMEAIHGLSGSNTIILIAHRLKTVRNCDQIYFIEDGEINDQGTYDELIEKNERFKNMASHA